MFRIATNTKRSHLIEHCWMSWPYCTSNVIMHRSKVQKEKEQEVTNQS